MSILEPGQQQPLSPSVENVARRLKSQAFQQFQQLIGSYEQGLRQFWRNQFYTPQEISDALGTDAFELFQLHGTIKQVILSVKPDQDLTPVSYYGSFTPGPSGSITIDSVTENP